MLRARLYRGGERPAGSGTGARQGLKERPWLRGGLLALIGYILSPLSWWNDAFVNLPLAYAFGFLCALFGREFFLPATIFGYWLSNIAGFILMHHGLRDALQERRPYNRKELVRYLLISLAYTLLVVCLIRTGWMPSPAALLKSH